MNQEDVKVAFYLKKNVFGKPRAEANSFALCRGEKRCTNVNETDSAGRCPVMGRLTIGHSESVFSAKMLAPRSLWMSGRAKGKSTVAVEINRRLDELRASAISIYREQSAVRERVTAEEVKCLLLGMAFGQETLLDYFRSHIEYFEKRVGVNRVAKSVHTYRCACEHVERFLSERLRLSDTPFSALDRSFIDKFDLYLRTERELAPSTIVLYKSCLHTVINKAIAAGIITADLFAGYEPPHSGRKLTFHMARHNFGTHITLSLGVPIETVSRMMGHRRLVTTQIYTHVTDKKVDEDTKQLRKLSASRKIELYEEPIKN